MSKIGKAGKKNHNQRIRERREKLRTVRKQKMRNPSGESHYARKCRNGGGGGFSDDRPAVVVSSAVEYRPPEPVRKEGWRYWS